MPAPLFVSLDKLSAWTVAAAYSLLWLLVSSVVYVVLHRSLARMATARDTKVSHVLAATIPRPASIAVFLIGVAGGLRLLQLPGSDVLELHKVLSLTLGVVGVAVLMRIAFRSIDAFGRSNPDLRSSAGIGRAVTWVVGLGIVAVLVSDALGISLAPALTALGVGSLSVALALQDTLSNFFAGVYIIFDKPVRPGDYIRVDPNYDGYVQAIGWRSTQLKTMSNNLVIIPNATLSKAIITNYSLPTPAVASSVRVDVVSNSDVDKVEDALADEAKRAVDLPSIAKVPEPSVALTPGFVDGVIAFTVFFYVQSFGEQWGAQHALRKRIAARLKKEGIGLATASVIVRRDA
jgi:small-conductance mechanosensitive channel